MEVYVIEFLADKGLLGKIISKVTGTRFSHTGMMIGNVFLELDAVNDHKKQADYHFKEYQSVMDYLMCNPEKERTVAYRVPHEFTDKQAENGIMWWARHYKKRTWYGYSKLFRFLYISKLKPFCKLWYKIFKKPYKPIGDTESHNVCSEAVGICLKKMGWWYDKIDKKYAYLSPEIMYPGDHAKILKEWMVVTC